jgi:hypothetical protein
MTFLNWLSKHQQLDEMTDLLEAERGAMPKLTAKKKAGMKRHVMRRIDELMEAESLSFDDLAAELEQLTLNVQPTHAFRSDAREDVLAALSLRSQRVWLMDLFRDLVGQRRVWATIVASVLLFVGAFGYTTRLPQVSAAKVSQVVTARGEVTLERNGAPQELTPGFQLQEGDVIRTGGNGWVDLSMVDDSLVVAGPDTTLVVNQLWNDAGNQARTSVSIEVEQGRVWSSVMNLLSNGSAYTLTVDDAEFSVDRRASFDVYVQADDVQMRVFEQLVDFNVQRGNTEHTGTMGPNLIMAMGEDDSVVISKLTDAEELRASDVWVQSNIESARVHQQNLDTFYRERVQQQAGVLPGDARYWAKRGLEDLQLLMTFDDRERLDKAKELADRRFSEAAVLMESGETEQAQAVLAEYQAIMLDLSEVNGFENVQPLIEENKKWIEGVSDQQGTVSDLRAVLDETAVLAATDDTVRSEVQLDTAADRLDLALEFLEIGAYDLAQKALQDYQAQLTEVIGGLGTLDMDQRREVVMAILEQKLSDLKRLKLIQVELEALAADVDDGQQGVQDEVTAAYGDTLYQLNALVLSLKERAVLELNTFLADVKGDETLQRQVLNRLKKTVDLDLAFIQLFNDIEALYEDDSGDVLILEDNLVTDGGDKELPLDEWQEGKVQGGGLPQDQEVRGE